MGERRGVYRVSVEKPEGKRPLGRPRHREDNNIKTDLQEVKCKGMEWNDVAQNRDRLVGTCECSNEPTGSTKCREFLE
jgi:hypothetical protein